jgi:hypothetical protein
MTKPLARCSAVNGTLASGFLLLPPGFIQGSAMDRIEASFVHAEPTKYGPLR